jgi:putative transposase
MSIQTRGYRYRIYPNKEQTEFLNRSLGCARFVWNQLLAKSIKAYEAWKNGENQNRPNVSPIGLTYDVLPLKSEYPWLYEVSSASLNQKARDLGTAFSNFFKAKGKIGYPKFKKKSNTTSIRLSSDAFRLKDGRFSIARCKTPIKVRWSRELPSEPSSCTISKIPSGEWYVSFICEVKSKLTDGCGQVGLDLGLTHFLTDSDGNKVENPRYFLKYQQRLAFLQRQHSRKQKGSKNREKSRLKVAKLHQRIRNARQDFLHKLSRQLVNENQVIGIETLNVKGMVRNRALAKHIADAGWSKFVDFLAYKVKESQHCILVGVETFFPSSHICSVCDAKLDHKLSLKERKWSCFCDAVHDRDINASLNIKKRAVAMVQHLKSIPGSFVLIHDLD